MLRDFCQIEEKNLYDAPILSIIERSTSVCVYSLAREPWPRTKRLVIYKGLTYFGGLYILQRRS